MADRRITIQIDEKVLRKLKVRADKNFLSVKELIEDIVRRSMLSYSKRSGRTAARVDDKLVAAFSRDKRGRKKKKS